MIIALAEIAQRDSSVTSITSALDLAGRPLWAQAVPGRAVNHPWALSEGGGSGGCLCWCQGHAPWRGGQRSPMRVGSRLSSN
jgi:hypothetical protein